MPLVPWLGFVLAGMAIARPALPALRAGAWMPRSKAGKTIAAAGRHSLVIYLAHQPLLLGASYLALLILGPNPHAEEMPFRRGYEAQCERSGGRPDACAAAGLCLVGKLRAEKLWSAASGDRLSPNDRVRAIDLSTRCYAEATRQPR